MHHFLSRLVITGWLGLALAGAGAGAEEGVFREQRGRGVRLVEPLEDGERLRESPGHAALDEGQRGHLHHRVERAVRVGLLRAAVGDEVHGHVLEGDALEVQPDAHAPARRAAPVVVQDHRATTR